MIQDLDLVALTRALPEHGLNAGDVGTVVMVHNEGEAFIVEFTTDGGELIALPTLAAGDIRPASPSGIAAPRRVA